MAQGKRLPDRFCTVCGKQLARRKRNPDRPDLCRPCTQADPDMRARISATMKARCAQPEERARRGERSRQAMTAMYAAGGEVAERWRETARALGRRYGGSVAGSEQRKRAAAACSRTRLAHIPMGYRDEYRRLVRNGRLSAAEAAAVIQDQVKIDERRIHERRRKEK